MELTLKIPVKVVTEGNAKEHWRVKHGRAKKQRHTTWLALASSRSFVPALPATVTLTRHGVRLLDSDNLQGSLKHVRDEIAKWFGCGDGPKDPLTWKYAQETGKEYAVTVRIESAPA